MPSASKNKTQATAVSVDDFLATVEHEQRRADGHQLVKVYRRLTGEPPVMWGPSIIGFGRSHYRYASGREGDTGAAIFSPGVSNLTVHLADGVSNYEHLLPISVIGSRPSVPRSGGHRWAIANV